MISCLARLAVFSTNSVCDDVLGVLTARCAEAVKNISTNVNVNDAISPQFGDSRLDIEDGPALPELSQSIDTAKELAGFLSVSAGHHRTLAHYAHHAVAPWAGVADELGMGRQAAHRLFSAPVRKILKGTTGAGGKTVDHLTTDRCRQLRRHPSSNQG